MGFFQNCWHLKDWVRHDTTLDEVVRERIVAAAESSDALLVASDLANGTKHFNLYNPRVGARDGAIQVQPQQDGSWHFHHMIDRNDREAITAMAAAEDAMAEWRRIFEAEGLPFFYDPEDVASPDRLNGPSDR